MAELREPVYPFSLILANQMEKDREVGMILNISARADFDLSF